MRGSGSELRAAVGETVAWALVRPDSDLLSEDRHGLLAAAPALLSYASAALESDLEDTAFLWESTGGQMLRVAIERVPAPLSSPAGRELTVTVARHPYGLTRRELQVLTLMTGGLSNGDIGMTLGIAARTIATHVERILDKLDQSARSGAAAVAVDQGLLCLPLPASTRSLLGLSVGMLDQAVRRGPAPPFRQPHRPLQRRPILLGLIVPDDDAATGDSDDMQKGAAMAIGELNRRGIAGRRIQQVVVRTDVGSSAQMAAAIDELNAAGVDAITFGYIRDRAAIPGLIEHAAQAGCPVLHASTSDPALQVVRENPTGTGSVFQICGPEGSYGEGFIRFVDTLVARGQWAPPNRRLAALSALDAMVVLTDQSSARAEHAGWHLTPIATGDADTIVARIAALDPAAVLLPTFTEDRLLLNILAGLHVHALAPLVYTVYTPSIPGFVQEAGPLAEGLVWSTVTGLYGDVFGTQFARRFQSVHGRPPGRSQASVQYDAVHLLARAWAEVGQPRSYVEVCDALRHNVYRGVNGAYWLGAPGQSALTYPDATPDPSIGQAHLVFQVQEGEHRIIAPDLYAESTFRPIGHPADLAAGRTAHGRGA